jgi:hypothetical protein
MLYFVVLSKIDDDEDNYIKTANTIHSIRNYLTHAKIILIEQNLSCDVYIDYLKTVVDILEFYKDNDYLQNIASKYIKLNDTIFFLKADYILSNSFSYRPFIINKNILYRPEEKIESYFFCLSYIKLLELIKYNDIEEFYNTYNQDDILVFSKLGISKQ